MAISYCVAAGCSSTHKDGVHLYVFPKDSGLRKKWADQVRRSGNQLTILGSAANTLRSTVLRFTAKQAIGIFGTWKGQITSKT